MQSQYILQHASKVTCPHCKATVDLLCREDAALTTWFYICWNCRTAFELGRGEVKREK